MPSVKRILRRKRKAKAKIIKIQATPQPMRA